MSKGIFHQSIFFGLCAVLVAAPLTGGAVKDLFLWPMVMAIGLLFWLTVAVSCGSCDFFKTVGGINRPLILLIILAFVSFAFSVDRYQSFNCLLRWVAFGGFFYSAIRILNEARRNILVVMLVGLGFFLSALGLLQYAGVVAADHWVPRRFLASTYVNHNHFSGFLELIVPLSLGVFLKIRESGRLWRWVVLTAVSVMLTAILLAQSRGAWISLSVALALMLASGVRNRLVAFEKALLVFSFVVLALIAISVFSPILSQRLRLADNMAGDAFSWQTRLKIWQGAWDMVKARPWTGFGVGAFAFAFGGFRPEGLLTAAHFAHNDYLQSAAEMGVFVLPLLFWLLGVILRKAFVSRDWITIGCGTGILSMSLHGFVDFNFHIPANLLLCICFAALIISRECAREVGEGDAL